MTPSQRQQVDVAVHSLLSSGRWRPQMWDQPGAVAAGEAIPLELPPNRKIRDAAAWPGTGHRNWPLEAAIGTLKDSAAVPDKALRVLVMFSQEADGTGTTTVAEDVAEQALALGIPVYPVFTHSGGGPSMRQWAIDFPKMSFGRLAQLTGGRPFVPPFETNGGVLNADVLRDILKAVRNDGLSQYLVGFVPGPSAGTKREHKLEIKLVAKSTGELAGGKRRTTY